MQRQILRWVGALVLIGLLSCRLLAKGDVFAVSIADSVGTAEILASLLRDGAISTGVRNQVVYLRVDKMLPASSTSMLVDPEHSAMTMKVQQNPHILSLPQ